MGCLNCEHTKKKGIENMEYSWKHGFGYNVYINSLPTHLHEALKCLYNMHKTVSNRESRGKLCSAYNTVDGIE